MNIENNEQNLDNKINKRKDFVNNIIKSFKFTSLDIAICGIFLSIQLITMVISRMTILRIIPLDLEFLFYIIYGAILGPFKGAMLAFMGDVLNMLIGGTIGLWYYGYALVSISIPIISFLFVYLFKKNKYFQLIFPIFVITLAISIAILTLLKFSNNGRIFLQTSRKGNKYPISISIIIIIMSIYILFALLAVIAFFVIYKKTQKEKWKNYLLIFSLIIFIIVIFRWTFGSMLYIDYFNKIKAPQSPNPMSIKEHYLLFTYPIIIKSLFTIPIYTAIGTPIFNVVEILKEKYLDKNNKVSY